MTEIIFYDLGKLEAALAQRDELAAEIERLRTALRSVSTQCSNVIYNCEQRPSDNERHLASWRNVKEFADRFLGDVGGALRQGEQS